MRWIHLVLLLVSMSAASAIDCAEGYAPGTAGACEQCLPGTYSDTFDDSLCKPCEEGRTSYLGTIDRASCFFPGNRVATIELKIGIRLSVADFNPAVQEFFIAGLANGLNVDDASKIAVTDVSDMSTPEEGPMVEVTTVTTLPTVPADTVDSITALVVQESVVSAIDRSLGMVPVFVKSPIVNIITTRPARVISSAEERLVSNLGGGGCPCPVVTASDTTTP